MTRRGEVSVERLLEQTAAAIQDARMDIVAWLSLLVAAALLTTAFLRHKIGNADEYRSAITMYVWALILYYPVSVLPAVGSFLSFVTRPAGFVMVLLSLRLLCLALLPPAAELRNSGTTDDHSFRVP